MKRHVTFPDPVGYLTTSAQVHYIWLCHIWDRVMTAFSTTSNISVLHRILSQSVCIRLKESGQCARRTVWGVNLTAQHRQRQRHWCWAHMVWPQL